MIFAEGRRDIVFDALRAMDMGWWKGELNWVLRVELNCSLLFDFFGVGESREKRRKGGSYTWVKERGYISLGLMEASTHDWNGERDSDGQHASDKSN